MIKRRTTTKKNPLTAHCECVLCSTLRGFEFEFQTAKQRRSWQVFETVREISSGAFCFVLYEEMICGDGREITLRTLSETERKNMKHFSVEVTRKTVLFINVYVTFFNSSWQQNHLCNILGLIPGTNRDQDIPEISP